MPTFPKPQTPAFLQWTNARKPREPNHYASLRSHDRAAKSEKSERRDFGAPGFIERGNIESR